MMTEIRNFKFYDISTYAEGKKVVNKLMGVRWYHRLWKWITTDD
jgi:hypothetical protein